MLAVIATALVVCLVLLLIAAPPGLARKPVD
jgi:hypothetical protein